MKNYADIGLQPRRSRNQLWNCTHFRHPTDEQLRQVDIYFLATNIICSLSTLNTCNSPLGLHNYSYHTQAPEIIVEYSSPK